MGAESLLQLRCVGGVIAAWEGRGRDVVAAWEGRLGRPCCVVGALDGPHHNMSGALARLWSAIIAADTLCGRGVTAVWEGRGRGVAAAWKRRERGVKGASAWRGGLRNRYVGGASQQLGIGVLSLSMHLVLSSLRYLF